VKPNSVSELLARAQIAQRLALDAFTAKRMADYEAYLVVTFQLRGEAELLRSTRRAQTIGDAR
jgi:hypothetical protein